MRSPSLATDALVGDAQIIHNVETKAEKNTEVHKQYNIEHLISDDDAQTTASLQL
jgi:hypothetical protein